MSARFVVAGAALPRAEWFPLVSQWANAGALPIELVKCVGLGELATRIEGSRPFSAALIDGGMPGIDRDLITRMKRRGAAVIVVDEHRSNVEWGDLGVDAVLPRTFDGATLIGILGDVASVVRSVELTTSAPSESLDLSPVAARTIAVTGSGGTGASTVAMAIAEACGRVPGPTVLADFCLTAELAMLHDTHRVSPGLQELIDAHRTGHVGADQLHDFLFTIDGRGYELLVGIRRRRLWTTIRPEAAARALVSLQNHFANVVIDCDHEFDGESESGSIDIEERNGLTRTAIEAADTIVAVGTASLKGLHSLTTVIGDLRSFGIDDERIRPVINYAPVGTRARSGYASALRDLCTADGRELTEPIFVPVRNVDERLRAVAPLPAGIVDAFGALVRTEPSTAAARSRRSWTRILPGSLAGAQS